MANPWVFTFLPPIDLVLSDLQAVENQMKSSTRLLRRLDPLVSELFLPGSHANRRPTSANVNGRDLLACTLARPTGRFFAILLFGRRKRGIRPRRPMPFTEFYPLLRCKTLSCKADSLLAEQYCGID
jgi:hypothetical protein